MADVGGAPSSRLGPGVSGEGTRREGCGAFRTSLAPYREPGAPGQGSSHRGPRALVTPPGQTPALSLRERAAVGGGWFLIYFLLPK